MFQGIRNLWVGLAMIALAGCASFDKFGDDPVEYYAKHPIKNKVETKTLVETVQLSAAGISNEQEAQLRRDLRGISPAAMESVKVMLSRRDLNRDASREAVKTLLRHLGYSAQKITFAGDDAVQKGQASIALTYAAVVLPPCPDWSMSPVTSYSNTWQGNYGCAHEVNIGLMVEDPHDLVEGQGSPQTSTTRAAHTVQNYNDSVSASSSSSSGSSGSSSTSSSGGVGSMTSVAPQAQ